MPGHVSQIKTGILPCYSASENVMNAPSKEKCPRCGEGRLRAWNQLSEEEREVVRRLPGSADYTFAERIAMHRWCTRCWYEAMEGMRAEG